MASLKEIGHLLFLASVTGLYVYALIYDTALFRGGKYTKAGFPFDNSFGGRAKFLTYNNVVNIIYSMLTNVQLVEKNLIL